MFIFTLKSNTMKNQIIGKKIKQLRISKNLSQEKLADLAGLSLRTIQRIEKGKGKPSSDSISRLSTALDEHLAEAANNLSIEKILSIRLIYLSSLTFIIFPPLGFLTPSIIWIYKKEQLKGNEKLLKSLLYFQIAWCLMLLVFPFALYFFLDTLIMIMDPFVNSNIGLPRFSRGFHIFSWVILYIFNLYITLKRTWRLDQKDEIKILGQSDF